MIAKINYVKDDSEKLKKSILGETEMNVKRKLKKAK